MSYSVQTAKADLEAMLHGTTLNQITNIDGLFNRAARQVLADVDPQETKRIVPIANTVFNSVYDYTAPADLKGNKVIDIRPQVNRNLWDIWQQNYNQDFDVSKQVSLMDQFTINFNASVKTIRINSPTLPQGVLVNNADGVSSNGAWSVGGGAASITTDNINYASGGGSLKFNLTAGQASGYVENSTMSQVDLTQYLNQGTFFAYVYLPTASSVSAVSLRWGSSSTAYYEVSTSITQSGTVFQDGWNLLAFSWLGATVVGSPSVSAIDYLRATYTYNSTLQTGVHLNGIFCRLGTILEMEYYSKFFFRDAITNAFQETVTDDSNLINLDTETYNLYLYQVAYLASQQQQGNVAAGFDAPFFLGQYTSNLKRYMALYKSELQKPTQTYYAIQKGGYNRYLGRRYY